MNNTFEGQVALTLRLTVGGGAAQEILGGNIKNFDLKLDNWGWEGSLEFNVFNDREEGGADIDELRAQFLTSDLMALELDVACVRTDTRVDQGEIRLPFTLKGLVSERWFAEQTYINFEQYPVLLTRYYIKFCDAAQLLWRQHWPCQLYADATMTDLFDQQKGEKVELVYDFPPLDEVRPQIFLGLDASIGPASFYDFTMWWLDRFRAIWTYNYIDNNYSIRAKKGDTGEPFEIYVQEVDSVRFQIPVVPRYTPIILNSFDGEGAQAPVEIANPFAVTGVARDTLLRTPLAEEVDERRTLEEERLVTEPKPELVLDFKRFPAQPVFPGDLVHFQAEVQNWSDRSLQVKLADFRVYQVRLRGAALRDEPSADRGGENNSYRLNLEARLEQKADLTTPRLPAFVEPTYPVNVEGRVVSELGATDELTYDPQVLKNGLTAYLVNIPLWDKKIPVLYNPGRMPGQLFYPAYKDERVLVSLTWRKAWMEAFLDWREGVRWPKTQQGNHMLLGKTTQSCTSLLNYYENPAEPIFQVARTHNDDLQTIRISEGNLLIEVREDPAALPATSGAENADPLLQD